MLALIFTGRGGGPAPPALTKDNRDADGLMSKGRTAVGVKHKNTGVTGVNRKNTGVTGRPPNQ